MRSVGMGVGMAQGATAPRLDAANPRVLKEEDRVEVVSDPIFEKAVGSRGEVVGRYEKDGQPLFDIRLDTGPFKGSVFPYMANELTVIPREQKEEADG